jgi:hypothetical protein
MKNQRETKFAFKRDGYIQIITKYGECSSFAEYGAFQINNQRIYPCGKIENQIKEGNSGKWTIVDSVDNYAELAEKIAANMIIVSANDAIAAEKKAIAAADERKWFEKIYSEKMNYLLSLKKGVYSVEFSALVGLIKGNDGWRNYSYSVVASNGVDAFEKAKDFFNDNLPRNVSFVYSFCDLTIAEINFVG